MSDRLKYLNNGELRAEIAYAAGGDPTRYGVDSQRGLKKADMRRVADSLQPADNDLDVHELELRGLYEAVCEWAGGEYEPNAGNPWSLYRPNLKRIHRALDAGPMQEVAADD
jgi:hypothetical protein